MKNITIENNRVLFERKNDISDDIKKKIKLDIEQTVIRKPSFDGLTNMFTD